MTIHELITPPKPVDGILKEIESGKYRDCYLIYNRKSTDEPENQKNSLKYQKSENARFAYREHLKIAQVSLQNFCLDGVISEKHSGFKENSELVFGKDATIQYRIGRPKFYELVQFLSKGYFKGVIMLCWDRASRNKGDNTVINKLIMRGIDFRFTLASYDKTSAGALHMDIDSMFAEHNSRVTREKVKLNIKNKREQGFCINKAPVGYLNKGQMEHKPIDPIRAPIIVKFFELYATGEWSMSALARWATDVGFTMPPTRRKRTMEERMAEEEEDIPVIIEPICRPPRVSNIYKILNNHFYIGEVMGNDNRYVQSSSHQALISKDLFNRVKTVLENKNVSLHYVEKVKYPMRGMIRCAGCNRLYTPYTQKGILYFGCHCSKTCPNPKKSINITQLTEKIGKHISQLSFTDAEKKEINRRTKAAVSIIEKEQNKNVSTKERKQKKLKEDLAYLQDNKLTLLKAGVYTPETLVQEESRLSQELSDMDATNGITSAEIKEKVTDLIKLSELLKTFYSYYENANPGEKEQVIRILFSELSLSENTLNYKCNERFKVFETRFIVSCAREDRLSELFTSTLYIKTAINELREIVEPPAELGMCA